MTRIFSDTDQNIVRVLIDETLTTETVENLRTELDDYINTNDRVPNLVILAEGRPHWDSLSTFRHHLRLVHDHHKLIKKVAAVGDNAIFTALSQLVDHFVGAKIRHFKTNDTEAASAWAASVNDHPGEFKFLDGFPRDVLAIQAKGFITAQDYEVTLKPSVAEMEKEHDHIKLYFETSGDFRGCSSGAVWDDTRFGFAHLTTFKKMAVVTDIDWLRHALKILGPLWPAKIMAFDVSDKAEAKEWIIS